MSRDLFTVRGLWRALTPADRVVSFALLGLAGLTVGLRGASGDPTHAVVSVDRETMAALPLDRADRVVIEGRRGPVTIEIRDGGVRVVESDCPQRLCIAMGSRRRSGEVLACVPNALLIRLSGGRPDGEVPDAVSR